MSDERDWAKEFAELNAENDRMKVEVDAIQAEIMDLIGPAGAGAVTVTLDEYGLIDDILIDMALRKGLSSQQLIDEINLGIGRATAAAGISLLPTDPDSPLLAQLLSSLSAGEIPQSQKLVNDLKTVTVSSAFGVIVGVQADLGWVESSPDASVIEEIIRVCRYAAIETDLTGRYTNQGSNS